MISALKAISTIVAAPHAETAAALQSTVDMPVMDALEYDFVSEELVEEAQPHIQLEQSNNPNIDEVVGLLAMHGIAWSSFFDVLLPGIFFSELNKKGLTDLNGEYPTDIKEWFLPSTREHVTKRMAVWEKIFYLNLIPMSLNTILAWLGLTTGPNPVTGWPTKIWLQHGLSNIALPLFLYNVYLMGTLLVGAEEITFDWYLFGQLSLWMTGSFFIKFFAAPVMSVYLTNYEPDRYSSFLFPSLFYLMGWVQYNNDTNNFTN